ncbi:MAG: GNAT family N-acetyltransferase [Gammaproteobacteria bacterium]|jgi:ribosomal protein S18 acetylase RimI-like enzyme
MTEIRAIRPQELEFIPRLIPNQQELFLLYPDGEFPLTLQQLKALYEKRFEFTVILENGDIAGFANLYGHKPEEYAFIGTLFIVPEYRRRGLGRVLMQYMIKAAFEKYRLPEVRLSVFMLNQSALSLYQRLGFKVYDREQRLDPAGKPLELLHMMLKKSNPVS